MHPGVDEWWNFVTQRRPRGLVSIFFQETTMGGNSGASAASNSAATGIKKPELEHWLNSFMNDPNGVLLIDQSVFLRLALAADDAAASAAASALFFDPPSSLNENTPFINLIATAVIKELKERLGAKSGWKLVFVLDGDCTGKVLAGRSRTRARQLNAAIRGIFAVNDTATEAPASMLSRVGRSTSFNARAQCLIINRMVELLQRERIGASWHIDKELIADELGRRLAQHLRASNANVRCAFVTIDTDMSMSLAFDYVVTPKYDIMSVKDLARHYSDIGFKNRAQMLFAYLNSGTDETAKNQIGFLPHIPILETIDEGNTTDAGALFDGYHAHVLNSSAVKATTTSAMNDSKDNTRAAFVRFSSKDKTDAFLARYFDSSTVTNRKSAAMFVQANSPSKWRVFANETIDVDGEPLYVRPTIQLINTDAAAWRRGKEERKATLIKEAKDRSIYNASMMANQIDGETSRDRRTFKERVDREDTMKAKWHKWDRYEGDIFSISLASLDPQYQPPKPVSAKSSKTSNTSSSSQNQPNPRSFVAQRNFKGGYGRGMNAQGTKRPPPPTANAAQPIKMSKLSDSISYTSSSSRPQTRSSTTRQDLTPATTPTRPPTTKKPFIFVETEPQKPKKGGSFGKWTLDTRKQEEMEKKRTNLRINYSQINALVATCSGEFLAANRCLNITKLRMIPTGKADYEAAAQAWTTAFGTFIDETLPIIRSWTDACRATFQVAIVRLIDAKSAGQQYKDVKIDTLFGNVDHRSERFKKYRLPDPDASVRVTRSKSTSQVTKDIPENVPGPSSSSKAHHEKTEQHVFQNLIDSTFSLQDSLTKKYLASIGLFNPDDLENSIIPPNGGAMAAIKKNHTTTSRLVITERFLPMLARFFLDHILKKHFDGNQLPHKLDTNLVASIASLLARTVVGTVEGETKWGKNEEDDDGDGDQETAVDEPAHTPTAYADALKQIRKSFASKHKGGLSPAEIDFLQKFDIAGDEEKIRSHWLDCIPAEYRLFFRVPNQDEKDWAGYKSVTSSMPLTTLHFYNYINKGGAGQEVRPIVFGGRKKFKASFTKGHQHQPLSPNPNYKNRHVNVNATSLSNDFIQFIKSEEANALMQKYGVDHLKNTWCRNGGNEKSWSSIFKDGKFSSQLSDYTCLPGFLWSLFAPGIFNHPELIKGESIDVPKEKPSLEHLFFTFSATYDGENVHARFLNMRVKKWWPVFRQVNDEKGNFVKNEEKFVFSTQVPQYQWKVQGNTDLTSDQFRGEFISVDSTKGLATASRNKECRTPIYEKYLIDGDLCRTELYKEAINPKGSLWVGIDIGDKETAIVGVVLKWIPREEKFVITQLLEKKVKNRAKLKEMKMDELIDTSPTGENSDEFRTVNEADYSKKAESHLRDTKKIRSRKASAERKRARRLLKANLDRYYSRIANTILEMGRRAAIEMGAKQYRAPVISIGYYARNKEMMKRLAQNFLVIAVSEYLTSKRCSRCYSFVRNTSKSTHRRYFCQDKNCYCSFEKKQYLQNKDVSAAINMVFILLGIIFNGARPGPFSKAKVEA